MSAPEQSLAWQRGKLDSRCDTCDATSAATSRCYRCHGRSLTYRTHADTPTGESFWCQQRAPDTRPKPHGIGRLRANKAPVAVVGAVIGTLGL